MPQIILLNPSTRLHAPSVAELFQTEIPQLREHYSEEEIQFFLQQFNADYFSQIADSEGRRTFPFYGMDATMEVYFTSSIPDSVDGALLSARYMESNEEVALLRWLLAREKGRGTGSTLIRQYLDDIVNAQVTQVAINVSKTNIGAKRLYERFCFTYLSDVPGNPRMEFHVKRL